MSIYKLKNFSGSYTPGPPLKAEGKKEGKKTEGEEKGKGGEGERVGDEGYTMWRGRDGIRKKGKREGRMEAHPRFSPTSPV
jgi:hypothetical protein